MLQVAFPSTQVGPIPHPAHALQVMRSHQGTPVSRVYLHVGYSLREAGLTLPK